MVITTTVQQNRWPWLMLPARLVLFAFWQMVLAMVLASLFLAAQHATLPLLFDGRFILWRLLMFIPFALFVGLLLRWRPQLLPYLAVVHGLLDMATVLMIPTAV